MFLPLSYENVGATADHIHINWFKMKNSKYVCTRLAVWCLYVQQHWQSNQICSRVSHETHKYEWNFLLKRENLLSTPNMRNCMQDSRVGGGWSLSLHVFNNKKIETMKSNVMILSMNRWVWSQTHKKVKLLLIVVFQALYCLFLFNLLFFLVFFYFSFGFNFFIRSKVLNPTTISHQNLKYP